MSFNLILDESLLLEAPGDGNDPTSYQKTASGLYVTSRDAENIQAAKDAEDAAKKAEAEAEAIRKAAEFDQAANDSIFDKEQLEIINGGYPKDQLEKIKKKAARQAKKGNLEGVKQLDSLIKNSEQFNSNTPKQRALSLLYQGESQFGDFTRYGEGFQIAVADAINRFGWMISGNPFLDFARKVTNNGKSVKGVPKLGASAAQALETLPTMIANGELKVDNKNLTWMTNEKAYNSDDPVFKVKALTLINGKTAEDFGDTNQVPDLTKRILDSTKKRDIEALLQDWQTKDGTANDRRSENVFKQVVKSLRDGGVKFDQTKLKALFDKTFAEGDKVGDTLQKMLSSGEWKNIA